MLCGLSKLYWENPCQSRFLHKYAARRSTKMKKSNLTVACLKCIPVDLNNIILGTDLSRKMLQSSGFMYSPIFIQENMWYIFYGSGRHSRVFMNLRWNLMGSLGIGSSGLICFSSKKSSFVVLIESFPLWLLGYLLHQVTYQKYFMYITVNKDLCNQEYY